MISARFWELDLPDAPVSYHAELRVRCPGERVCFPDSADMLLQSTARDTILAGEDVLTFAFPGHGTQQGDARGYSAERVSGSSDTAAVRVQERLVKHLRAGGR